jgi:hypothetical protein
MPHARSFDWETLISAWLEATQREEEARWAKAAMAKIVVEQHGAGGARQFASAVGVSARQVHKCKQTFDAFSADEARVASLSFEHHFLASCTESPEKWIVQAAERSLSLKQLREAILRAEAERQVAPRGSYRFGKGDEFEAHDLGVALVGENVERFILSKPQWLELIRLLAFHARANRWLDEEAERSLIRVGAEAAKSLKSMLTQQAPGSEGESP